METGVGGVVAFTWTMISVDTRSATFAVMSRPCSSLEPHLFRYL